MDLVAAGGRFDLGCAWLALALRGTSRFAPMQAGHEVLDSELTKEGSSYPEINLQIPASSKLPVANLERDCHLVVLVQRLVEAFALVRLHLDVVRGGEAEEARHRSESGD